MIFKKSFPHYIQLEQRDCGATCLQMLCKYYGCYFESVSTANLRWDGSHWSATQSTCLDEVSRRPRLPRHCFLQGRNAVQRYQCWDFSRASGPVQYESIVVRTTITTSYFKCLECLPKSCLKIRIWADSIRR